MASLIGYLLGWEPEPTEYKHKIQQLWLGNGAGEAIVFGVGIK